MLNHPSQGSDDAQDEKQGDFPVTEEEKTQAVMLKDSYVSDDVANSTERYNLSPSPEDEDFEAPTEEEMQTLRHVGGKIPMRCWLIAIVELSERFSYYGLSAPFQNYMEYGPNDSPKGVLSLNSQGATGLSYFFQFWCYVTPVFGGYVADTFWGKYNTICCGTAIYIAGIFILFITSIPSVGNRDSAIGGFIAAIILIGIATGMIKANLSVLIADQLPKRKPSIKVLKSGERVIVDSNITLQNVFMFFYFMINVGSLSLMATTELEYHKGFWAAYLLPFCFFWIAVVTLIFGKKQYIQRPIGDKVIAKSFKVCWILTKNKFDFNAAKPSVHPEKNYPWNDKFVDEIKRALAACKVFIFYPIYWTQYGTMISSFITQASMMELHGIPNDFLQAFDSIALIIFIPIFEKFVYPFIRRYTPLKPITKIFVGFMFGSFAMTWAAVLQSFVYKAGPWYNEPLGHNTPNHVHVCWQIPAYVLISFSEIFASITGLEYAYSKAPASMKSFIMSIFLLTNAFGSAIGCALSPVTVDPKFTWLFTGLAVACFISGCLFWLCFRKYNDTEEEMNAMDYEEEDEFDLNPISAPKANDIEILEPMESLRSTAKY